jgi:transcriptional antiterminator RfaH
MQAWYLVHCKPRQEALAKEQLERQNFATYLPLASSRVRRRGRAVRAIGPMFPRYLFIHLSDEHDDWRPIRSTIGVSGLVRFGQVPARVPDSLIQTLRAREDGEGVQILPDRELVPGQKVQIAEGPFEGYEAIFQSRSARGRVVVLLNILQKHINIELDQSVIVAD